MWGNKPTQPGAGSSTGSSVPGVKTGVPGVEVPRTGSPVVRSTAWLGPGIQVKGQISGDEDLHVDGKVEGPITLGGHRLTVGASAEVASEIVAREVVVQGKVHGDLRARDRIEIKKNGHVTGDLTTARIQIEDGAYFKGSIEIDQSKTQVGSDLTTMLARNAAKND